MFEKIRKFFEMGLYSEVQVRAFADKGRITPEEYTVITGDTYDG